MWRHFRKNGPFLHSGHTPSPSPVYPNPFPPKSMLYFGPSSLSFASDNIDSGVRGFTVFKRNEIINELDAPVLNKCVNYFCP